MMCFLRLCRKNCLLKIQINRNINLNSCQKSWISYHWSLEKQQAPRLAVFPMQGNLLLISYARKCRSRYNLGKTSTRFPLGNPVEVSHRFPIGPSSVVCFPLDFQQEINMSWFPNWKSTAGMALYSGWKKKIQELQANHNEIQAKIVILQEIQELQAGMPCLPLRISKGFPLDFL